MKNDHRQNRVPTILRITALVLLTLLATSNALADKPRVNQSGYQLSGTIKSPVPGIAANGYDITSYFANARQVARGRAKPRPQNRGRLQKGQPRFSFVWNGATWLFANNRNRQLFRRNPEVFAPQYGGYCSLAVANNATAPIEAPETAWAIYDGKLYFNNNDTAQQIWEQDKDGNIRAANGNWPGVLRD